MTSCIHFHVQLYARPRAAALGRPQILNGFQVTPLAVSHAELLAGLPITFDEVVQVLAQLPRMFIEPDGSFVWVAPQEEQTWQVDGVLYDRGQRLAYAELKGFCPLGPFNQLLAALDWPRTELAFALVQHGVVLGEEDFRRIAFAHAL